MTTIVQQTSVSAITLPEKQVWLHSATFFEQPMRFHHRKQKSSRKADFTFRFHLNLGKPDSIGTHFFVNNPTFCSPVRWFAKQSFYTDNFDLSVGLIPSQAFMVKAHISKISQFQPQISLD